MEIYAGNLSEDVTHSLLKNIFSEYGYVKSVTIIEDRHTGQSKGFGFVHMPDPDEALKAITHLDGYLLFDRKLKVNEARQRQSYEKNSDHIYNKKKKNNKRKKTLRDLSLY